MTWSYMTWHYITVHHFTPPLHIPDLLRTVVPDVIWMTLLVAVRLDPRAEARNPPRPSSHESPHLCLVRDLAPGLASLIHVVSGPASDASSLPDERPTWHDPADTVTWKTVLYSIRIVTKFMEHDATRSVFRQVLNDALKHDRVNWQHELIEKDVSRIPLETCRKYHIWVTELKRLCHRALLSPTR